MEQIYYCILGNVDDGGCYVGEGDIREMSVPSAQFY